MDPEIHFLVDDMSETIRPLLEKVQSALAMNKLNPQRRALLILMREVVRARARQHRDDGRVSLLNSLQRLRAHVGQTSDTPELSFPSPPLPSSVEDSSSFLQEGYRASALETPEVQQKIAPLTIPLVVDQKTRQVLASAQVTGSTYTLQEPSLTDAEMRLLLAFREQVRDVRLLDDQRTLYKMVQKMATEMAIPLSDESFAGFVYYLQRDLVHFGLVEPFLHDSRLHQLICEGPTTPLRLIRQHHTYTTNASFRTTEEINHLLDRFSSETHHHISADQPLLDAVYQNFRIQGILGSDLVPGRFIITRLSL